MIWDATLCQSYWQVPGLDSRYSHHITARQYHSSCSNWTSNSFSLLSSPTRFPSSIICLPNIPRLALLNWRKCGCDGNFTSWEIHEAHDNASIEEEPGGIGPGSGRRRHCRRSAEASGHPLSNLRASGGKHKSCAGRATPQLGASRRKEFSTTALEKRNRHALRGKKQGTM